MDATDQMAKGVKIKTPENRASHLISQHRKFFWQGSDMAEFG
jgi:hypothetical protein